MFNTEGTGSAQEKFQQKEELTKKIAEEQQKSEILEIQYQKSVETIQKIKEHLLELFEVLQIDQEHREGLRNSALTAQNLITYFGVLEEKGMGLIQEYSRIIAEQIKLEKGNQEEVNDQINNLLNIIEYENKEILNQRLSNKSEFPDYLFDKENSENPTHSTFKNYDELKKKAMNEIWKIPKMIKTQGGVSSKKSKKPKG